MYLNNTLDLNVFVINRSINSDLIEDNLLPIIVGREKSIARAKSYRGGTALRNWKTA